MNSVEPPTNDVQCQVFGTNTLCLGLIDIDLSSHSEIHFNFTAPPGMELQIDGSSLSNSVAFEFRASLPCGPDVVPGDTEDQSFFFQRVEGSMFAPDMLSSMPAIPYDLQSKRLCVGVG